MPNDYLLAAGGRPGQWMKLVNNGTGTSYFSTARSDGNGMFIHSAPPGLYTQYVSANVTLPAAGDASWVATGDTSYAVPLTVRDDIVANSLTLKAATDSSPYVATALSGWEDLIGVGQWGDGIWHIKSGKNPSGSAKADGQRVTDGAMSTGSAVLTSASNPFVAGDVNKLITVAGGGAAGAVLATTIASFQSAGQVTLTAANASGGNISAKAVSWASDDLLPIQAAINAMKAAGTGIVDLGAGDIMFSAPLSLTAVARSVTFRGRGNKTSRAATRLTSTGASFLDLGDGASGANDFTGKLTLLDMLWDGVDRNVDMVRQRNFVTNPGRMHWERMDFWGFGTGYGFRDAAGGVTTQDSIMMDTQFNFGGTGMLLMNGAWDFHDVTFGFLTKGLDIRANNKSVFTGCVFSGNVDDIYFGDTGITYTNPYLFLGCWHENSTDACMSSSTAIVGLDVTFDTCRLHTSGSYQVYMGGLTNSTIVLRDVDFGGVATKILTAAAGSGNSIISEYSRPLNRVVAVASPINSTRNSIGPHLLAADTFTGTAVASTDYLVQGCRGLGIFVTGGTGVSVSLKDRTQATNTVVGAGTTPLYVYVPVGWFINFGAFSVAPTVVCFVD